MRERTTPRSTTREGARDSSEGDTLVVGEPVAVAQRHGDPRIGTRLARYVVLEEVGRGGMGRVWRAYDPKLQREVALKEVDVEEANDEGSARLVAEARAMAKLSHGNVVAVYDVEEVGRDRLVLVMEYVAGRTLKAWLREPERSWRDVLAHFVAAGHGLAAAHGVGLLHRDFKPANVLVAADGAVKVTDFGLAKMAPEAHTSSPGDPEAVESSEDAAASLDGLTRAGLVMGTPRYMAPEQHEGGPLTPAVDQYAFCVALWEALQGEAPFAGPGLAHAKLRGPPPWPGGRAPRSVSEALRRGLTRDPGARWPGMEALLEALADDGSRRRRRFMSGLVATVILGGAAVAWRSSGAPQGDRCTGAEAQLSEIWDDARRVQVQQAILGIGASYAERVWAQTADALDGRAAEWVAMHTEACEATTVRGEQSSALMDLRMGCLRQAKMELRAVVDELAAADAATVGKAHQVVASLRPLSRCADVETLQADVEPPVPGDAEPVEEARARLAAATAAREAGRYDRARIEVEAAKSAISGVEYVPVRTEVALAEGNVLDATGEYEAADDVLREALMLASRSRQWRELADAATQLLFVVGARQRRFDEALRYEPIAAGLAHADAAAEAAFHSAYGAVLAAAGRYEEAEAEHRAALALRESAEDPEFLAVAQARDSLAGALWHQAKYTEAEDEHRRLLALREQVLGPEHPSVAQSRNNLANVLKAQARYADAEAEYRRALRVLEDGVGREHPNVAQVRNNLANALGTQGRLAEAEAEHRRALALRLKLLGPDHPDVAQSRNNLAVVLQDEGKLDEAEAEYRLALASWEKSLGPDHPDTASARDNVAIVLGARGRFAEAEAEHRRALASREKELGPDHPAVATSLVNLAAILIDSGKPAQAETELWRALALEEKAHDPDHPSLANLRAGLAELLLERGEVEQARSLVEQAWRRHQAADIALAVRTKTGLVLARAWWEGGDADARGRARDLVEGLRAEHAEGGTQADETAAHVRAWLERHPAR